MAIQLAVSTRNARLDAIETDIGSAPVLKIWTGTLPANCAAADAAGTVLVSMSLPTPSGGDWMQTASGGSKAYNAPWSAAATGTGTATHFRIYTTGGTVCKIQGTCGLGSGDMSLDNTSITSGQTVTVTAFTLNDANA